ncbi:MAG TPA: hypothetical protein VGD81_04745 [Opitutaceae bacterium]
MEIRFGNERILELWRFTVSAKIAATKGPISAEQREELKQMITLEAHEYQRALELECHRRLGRARAAAATLNFHWERLKVCSEELGESVRRFAEEHPSISLWLLYMVALVSAVATEYAFNASAVAYIMSLRQGSLLAKLVAVAVAMSIFALDEPLRKLIAEPAEQGKALKARALLLIAIGIINVVSLGLLGEARAQALLMQRSGNFQQASTIPMLVLVITLVVALNGALFWQVGRAEGARLFRRFKTRWAWAIAVRKEHRAGEKVREAEAAVKSLEAEAADRKRWEDIAQHFRHEKELELAVAVDCSRARPTSHKALVDQLLLEAPVVRRLGGTEEVAASGVVTDSLTMAAGMGRENRL